MKQAKNKTKTKKINLSMCQIAKQEGNTSNDLENPLLSDLNSSEWFEDESQLSFQKVKLFI